MINTVPRRMLSKFVVVVLMALAGSQTAFAKPDYIADFLLAVQRDDVRTVVELSEKLVSPNVREPKRGETALMIALRENSTKVFEVLLKHPDIDVEAKSDNGDNALMIAAWLGNLDGVQALIDAGAEVNRPEWTPLHYACANGHLEIVKLLIENSAYIDAASPNGTTPIMMAARGGHAKTVAFVYKQGADITLRNQQGKSAEDLATSNNFPDVAEYLNKAANGGIKR